jgi:hypothetical protein
MGSIAGWILPQLVCRSGAFIQRDKFALRPAPYSPTAVVAANKNPGVHIAAGATELR